MKQSKSRFQAKFDKLLSHFGNPDSLKNRLIRGAAGSLGLKLIYTSLTFITSILLARWLGSEGFGIYTYAISWASLLSIPAALGLDQLLVREVAIYENQSAWGLMRGLLRWSSSIVLLVSLSLTTIAIVTICLLGHHSDSSVLLPISLAMLSLPVVSLTAIRLAAIQGLHQVVKGLFPEFIIAPILLLSFSGSSYLLLGDDFSPLVVIALRLISATIAFYFGNIILTKILPEPFKNVSPRYQPKLWLRSAIPFVFLGGMQVINSRADILMLGAMQDARAAGIYVAVTQGANLILFVIIAANNALAPTLAKLYSRGEKKQLQNILTKSAKMIFVISCPLSITVILLRNQFLLLFGSDFTEGSLALVFLVCGQLFNASAGSVNLILGMSGHEKYSLISFVSSAILNVFLNFLLIPVWGISGAAIATSSSLILWNFLCLVWVLKAVEVNPSIWGVFLSSDINKGNR